MKQKLIALLFIGASALLFSACDGNKAVKEKENVGIEVTDGSTNINMNKEQNELVRLMEKGSKVKCEYNLNEGDDEGMKTILYLEGEKFKTEVDTGEFKAIGIFDGEYYYNWTKEGGMNQGSKMSKKCLEEMEGEVDEGEEVSSVIQFNDIQDIVNQEVELKMNCTEVNDVDFSIPSEINFVDSCEMMNKMNNQIENINMEEIQKQMERMQGGM